MKRLIIVLFLVSLCYGTPFVLLDTTYADVYTSHQLPATDSALDLGSAAYLWRFIYGDIFTDGTAYWESNQLYGFDEIIGTTIVAEVDLIGETITGNDIRGTNIIGVLIEGDLITGGVIRGDTLTDGTFLVSGGEISAGEIINTFGDIDIGGNTLTCWDIFTGQIIAHSTSDPQLLLRHTTGIDEAGFYVDSDGDLTITPTGGDIILPIHVTADELTVGTATDYTHFSTRGTMTLHGDARVKRHIVIGAASFKRGATAPTEDYETIFPTLVFADGRDDAAHYTTWVPFRWDNTTDMEVHVHWQMDDDTKVGNVLWNLNYIGVKEGEDPAGIGTLISQLSAGNHPDNELINTVFTTKMLAANLEREDDLGLKLWRNGDDGTDDLEENAELIAMHIHFTINQLGDPFETNFLLLETGDFLLLETGDKLILEGV